MQSVVHFSWWFVRVAFVTIAPSIATQEDRTDQHKRHVHYDSDTSTLWQFAHSLHSSIATHARETRCHIAGVTCSTMSVLWFTTEAQAQISITSITNATSWRIG